MFLGREKELGSLEQMYNKDGFQMAVVYGRRRIGKTYLLTEFVKDKNSLYLPAEEVNDLLNLQKFSRILGEKMGMTNFPNVENWSNFFSLIKEKFGNDKLVLIIDEYPYAATANKSLNSILQHVIDHELKDTNIFLILCGSSMSFMENQVLGEKSPLFGRRTGQLKVNPLDYYDSAKFYPNVSNEDKVKYYACVGGTPYYLSLIDEKLSFEENIKELYFSINGYLNNEGVLLMKQEFREPANYNAVLQAIASGSNTLGEIVSYTKLESNIVSKYLLVLQDLNYIERVIPFGANSLKGKTSRYIITENFLAFWYRYVFSVRGEIERGYGEIYAEVTLNDLPNFIGPIFEEISRQYLRRMNMKKELPFVAKTFGRWWGKDKKGNVQEVDVVVDSILDKKMIIGECKWRESFKLSKTIDLLSKRAEIFDKYTTYKFLFVKNNDISVEEDIVVVTLDEFYR